MKKKVIKLAAYTDAASYNNGKKDFRNPEHSASFGVILYKNKILCKISSYNPNTSISFGELFAIYNTLKWCRKQAKKNNCIIDLELYTDSAYSFQSITEWVDCWKKREVGGIWHNSSGNPVAYQNMISKIDDYVNCEYLNADIKHISGHIDMSNASKVWKAKKVFKRFNKEDVSFENLSTHVIYNDLCDISAKEFLRLGMKGKVESSYEGNEKLFIKYFSEDDSSLD